MIGNVSSCKICAALIDMDVLGCNHPEMYLDDGTVDTDNYRWDGEDYVPKYICPCCKGTINQDGYDVGN